jgi:hypothetical protein
MFAANIQRTNRSRADFPAIQKLERNMSTDELKNSTSLTTTGDGFDHYTDRVEGNDDSPQQQGLIRGSRVAFTNTAEWELATDGDVIEPGVKLIVTNIHRAVVKWGADKGPPEQTIEIPPGQPFPDIAVMNDAIPRDQWRQGPAGLQGPWRAQQLVVMIEPQSMNTFTYVTSTIGGGIAVRDLVDKVKMRRRYRGQVSPIVTLADTLFKTRFGERRRPHFNIVDWVHMAGGDEPQQAALPAPDKPGPNDNTTSTLIEAEPVKEEPPTAKPAKKPRQSKSKSGLKHAAPLSTKEELNDEIPW